SSCSLARSRRHLLPERWIVGEELRVFLQLIERIPDESALAVLDDLALAALVDHDGHATGRHRFDRGNAEVFRELGRRSRVVDEAGRVPEDAGATKQFPQALGTQVCLDD